MKKFRIEPEDGWGGFTKHEELICDVWSKLNPHVKTKLFTYLNFSSSSSIWEGQKGQASVNIEYSDLEDIKEFNLAFEDNSAKANIIVEELYKVLCDKYKLSGISN